MKKSYYGKLAVNHLMNKISRQRKSEMVKSGKVIARAMVGNLAIDHDINVITIISKLEK